MEQMRNYLKYVNINSFLSFTRAILVEFSHSSKSYFTNSGMNIAFIFVAYKLKANIGCH